MNIFCTTQRFIDYIMALYLNELSEQRFYLFFYKKKKKCTSVPHSLTLHVKTNVYQYIFSRFIPGDIFEKINTTCPSEVTVRFEWAEEKGTRDWAFLNDGLEIFPLLCNFITRIDMCIFFKKKFKSLISVHTFKFKYRSL